jgi:hypothetical protein
LTSKKGTIAAITAAMVAYMEEERALRPLVPQRKLVMVSTLWSSSGREQMMRILWQRRIVPKIMTFGCCPEEKL